MDDPRTDTRPISLKRIHRKLPLSCTLPLLCVSLLIDLPSQNVISTRSWSMCFTRFTPRRHTLPLSSIGLQAGSTRQNGVPWDDA